MSIKDKLKKIEETVKPIQISKNFVKDKIKLFEPEKIISVKDKIKLFETKKVQPIVKQEKNITKDVDFREKLSDWKELEKMTYRNKDHEQEQIKEPAKERIEEPAKERIDEGTNERTEEHDKEYDDKIKKKKKKKEKKEKKEKKSKKKKNKKDSE
jgi:hypothetical protein